MYNDPLGNRLLPLERGLVTNVNPLSEHGVGYTYDPGKFDASFILELGQSGNPDVLEAYLKKYGQTIFDSATSPYDLTKIKVSGNGVTTYYNVPYIRMYNQEDAAAMAGAYHGAYTVGVELHSEFTSYNSNQGPAANETPGVNVYHNLTFGGNWSFPGLGIHLYPNQPLSTQQHEYGHYLQYKKMNIVSYTWFVAIPSSINLALINLRVHEDDHDIQPYELEATTLADDFYEKNSRVGGVDSPTFRDYPELAPKTFQEGWNDIVRQFKAWTSWGH